MLKFDGVVTGLNGIGYLTLAGWLESFFGVEAAVYYPTGAFLLAFGIGVLVVGTRETLNKNVIGAIAMTNLLWVLLSLVVLVSDVLSPTSMGTVWIVLQALVVVAFSGLQYVGLKKL